MFGQTQSAFGVTPNTTFGAAAPTATSFATAQPTTAAAPMGTGNPKFSTTTETDQSGQVIHQVLYFPSFTSY